MCIRDRLGTVCGLPLWLELLGNGRAGGNGRADRCGHLYACLLYTSGRLKNMSEAERQNYLATEEAQRAVHILLVSNVCLLYTSMTLAINCRPRNVSVGRRRNID